MIVSKKFIDNLKLKLKKYQKIIQRIQSQDANEANTVDVIMDFLSDVLGYERYVNITREKAIKNKYCDIAVLDDKTKKTRIIIEVKAVGVKLEAKHLTQAVNYCANEGVEWAILTNSKEWKVYKILMKDKKIEKELFIEFNLLDIKLSDGFAINKLYSLSKYGIEKSAISQHYLENQCRDEAIITAMLLSKDILAGIKRGLKKEFKNAKITEEDLFDIIKTKIIKEYFFADEKNVTMNKLIKKLNKSKITKAKTVS